jgi:putative heme transporter
VIFQLGRRRAPSSPLDDPDLTVADRESTAAPPPPELDGSTDDPFGPGSPEVDVAVDPVAPGGLSALRVRRGGLRGILPAPVLHVGRLLILALVIEYLVVPQLAGPRRVAHLVMEVNPLLLLAGVGLEAASLLSYAQLTRTVLPARSKVSLFTILRVELTTLSVSHCAPGGSATGAAIGYKLLTQAGAGGGDAGFALALQAIWSALILNVILWIALIVSIPVYGFSAVYLLAAAVGVALLVVTVTLFLGLTRGELRMADAMEAAASRLPFVDAKALRGIFLKLSRRLNDLVAQRGVLIRASGWAAANWLLDAASLWVFIGAFGGWVSPDGLLVAYGLAYVLAAIPITPGGLGVVEATLTSILVGFGTSRGVATLGVVAYRLINFWLPIPIGGLAYLSLQMDPGDPAQRRTLLASAGRRLARVFRWPPRETPDAPDTMEVSDRRIPTALLTPDPVGAPSPPG